MAGIVGKIVIVAVGLQLSAFSQAGPASGVETSPAVERLRQELAECRAECERLRAENERLRRSAAEDLAAFFDWMIEAMSDEDVYLTSRILEGFEIGLDEWSRGDRGRMELVGPALKKIKLFVAQAGRQTDDRSGDRSHSEGSASLPPIEVSPARLREELAEIDRGKIAETVVAYRGREVVWRGRVLAFSGRTLELVCDGVIVRAAVERGGEGLKAGDAAAVRGWIADIEGNGWVGVEVRIRRASVLADPGGMANPPALSR